MGTQEESYLFTGNGDLTCHQFIRSIREHAIKEGKARDDEWIADQTSIRFDGDALKWFENLDVETQGNWKRLRSAILARYGEPAYEETPANTARDPNPDPLVFKGETESEGQEFVSQIRQRATAEGKDKESEWMVRLAFPCFRGKALKWHASLPFHVQSDWKLLERAILLNYPHQPTPDLSPARIQVNDWYTPVPPSFALRSIDSYADWISQAQDRRREYIAANNKAILCWLLINSEKEIPGNAIRMGTDTRGDPLYSARAWYQDAGIIVGKCGPHLRGAHIPLNGVEIPQITPFEILVGDFCRLEWVEVLENREDQSAVTAAPFLGVEAGYEKNVTAQNRAIFVTQLCADSTLQPGKGICGQSYASAGFFLKEITQNNIRVLAWAEPSS